MSLTKGTTDIVKGFMDVMDLINIGLESHAQLQLWLREFGWVAPVNSADMVAVNAIFTFKSVLDQLRALNNTLNQPDSDEITVLEQAIPLLETVYDGIKNIASAPPTSGMPFPLDQNEFWLQFQDELPEYIIHRYLEEEHKVWYSILFFLGILDKEGVNPSGPNRTSYIRRRVHWGRVPQSITDPAGLFSDTYNWGAGKAFNHSRFLSAVEKILDHGGYAASQVTPEFTILNKYYHPTNPHRNHIKALELPLVMIPTPAWDGVTRLGVSLMPIPPASDDKAPAEGFMITPLVEGSATGLTGDDQHGVSVAIQGKFEANGLFRFNILPIDSGIDIDPAEISIEGGLVLQAHPEKPWIIIGSKETFYLELEGVFAGLQLKGSIVDPEFVVEIGTSQKDTAEAPKLVAGINFADGDGFISNLFGGKAQEVKLGGLMSWSSKNGVRVNGQLGFEIQLVSHLSIGPITFQNMKLGLAASGADASLKLDTDFKTELGPFTALVEEIGMQLLFIDKSPDTGVFGNLDFEFGFKPPTGIGLSLDAGVVKGGGFLSLDFEKGQYSGALELDFQGLFGFSAVGIITTKFPDGSEGFSLLLLINVTFDTPITLGFNFYLAGIGGLIGLHRTIITLALQKGVKDGSIDNILFPENVIANITKIISDLEAIFPVKQDQFVLGIMAQITWNTPALLIIEAGLVVEFPSPVKIAILGVIKCQLPTPDEAILKLNVAFMGIIDFENEILMFDASIFDSRILTVTLEGDMALRISWGAKPDFLVSVGGFHPVYSPPAHLQLLVMKRMTVNILSGNPNLVLKAYFALTTNTIQFGASLDFSFKVSKFGVYGNFGFDVLIQFSPFRFIAGVHASVAVKLGSSTLFSIGLEFNLEGPSPWRAHGYASFRILFIKFKVKFDKTWGEKKENTLPATSVLPLLLEEFQKDENWDAKPHARLIEPVTLSDSSSDPDAVLVRPYGSLELDQMVVPLDLTLEKFGNYQPDDISKVTISEITIGGETYAGNQVRNLKNSFAPAAYKEMGDSDKLEAPSYTDENSGMRVTATDDIVFDYGINRLVEYESILSDFEEEELGKLSFNQDFFKVFVSGGEVGRSPFSQLIKNNSFRADKTVITDQEKFAVVSSVDLTNAHADNLVFDSKAEADEYLRETIKADPSQKGKVQLSPAFQMVDA